ncbi:MAG: hypothetical protein JWO30_3203 [Fibrobacteres bacterium]|nr:hypothetical protein [Fibrobacterota bacterium]
MLGKHVGPNRPRGFESPTLCHLIRPRKWGDCGATVSKNQHLSLETCYSKDISPFKSVIMSSQEARFINEQANLGFIKLAEKPTTIAIQKFKDGKLEIIKEAEPS